LGGTAVGSSLNSYIGCWKYKEIEYSPLIEECLKENSNEEIKENVD
jgi:hypothetical protein